MVLSGLRDRARALLRRRIWSRRGAGPWFRPESRTGPQVGLLVAAGAVGVLAALVEELLLSMSGTLGELFWGGEGAVPGLIARAPTAMRLLLPAAGGVVAGLVLVYGIRVTRAASGWGLLEAVVLRDGVLKFRPALIRSLSSLLTIATGGPVGREGPIVLMASTLASKMGQWLHMPTRHLRVLTAAGVASGMAAAYNAPVASSLFAMEIILGTFAMDVFAPLVCASVAAIMVNQMLHGGSQSVFSVPDFQLVSSWELGAYLLVGIGGGLLSVFFLNSLRLAARFFQRLRLGRPLSMGLVGLLLGVVFLYYPQISGGGRGLTNSLLNADYAWRLAGILLILKLLMSGLTVGAGAVGGLFTPSLFIGGAMGFGVGTLVHHVAPAAGADPAAYALVGMGAMLAGTTHAPIMAIMMIFELSLNYSLLLPLMLACATASLLAHTLSPDSIYTEALKHKGAYLDNPEAKVMTSLKVRDIMRREFQSVAPHTPLPQVLDRFLEGRRNHLYVVDDDRRFLGAISLHDLKEALQEREEISFIIAHDLMRPTFEVTTPGEDLARVMERLWAQDCERIPVVADGESRRLVGTVSKRDILGVYSLEVMQRRTLVTKFRGGEGPDASAYVELPQDHHVDGVRVGEALAGSTLAESRLREKFGVTVLMIRRRLADGGENRLAPTPATRLEAGDGLVVFGPREGISRLKAL
ncbi:MAG: chloride channel protein [Acidobacteria bacterium]|nr:chloride channel protein [Acidobacteriota bacterium]